MWKLSIEDDQGNKTLVHLVRDEYSVGRAEASTVRLTERNISRKHLELVREAGGWVVVDRKSYNGVHVNGARVHEKKTLAHGDIVQLGDYRMEIGDESLEAKDTIPLNLQQESQINQDRLVVLAGLEVGTEFALTGERMVLGRGEECDIVLNHASVSRQHAEITALGDGRYEFVDKESANGVRINGVELKRSLLDASDTIELGDVVLKFIPAGQQYQPALDRSLSLIYSQAAPATESSPPPAKPMSLGLKAIGVLAAVGALTSLAIVVARSGSGEPAGLETLVSGKQDATARLLSDAQALLALGEVEGAHQKLSEIPEDSNVRQSTEFRKIEAKWAQALFQHAEAETDPTVKRALLDQIALSPSVDTASRKRAQSEIAKLSSEAVDINELPTAPRENLGPTPAKAATPGQPKLPPGGIVRENPYE